jgi:hypothetical protein
MFAFVKPGANGDGVECSSGVGEGCVGEGCVGEGCVGEGCVGEGVSGRVGEWASGRVGEWIISANQWRRLQETSLMSGEKPLPPGEVGGNLPVRAHDSNSYRVFISTPHTLSRSTARDLAWRER